MDSYYVYSSAFIAQISGLMSSTAATWSSPMLVKLNGTDDNPLGRPITSSENSWLASLPVLGGCFGAVMAGVLAKSFGRKTLLIFAGVPFFVFNLVMAWATNIWLFYISRFGTGIGLGIIFPVLSMYTGEIADVNNRGILGCSMSVFITAGMLIPYCLGPFISILWFQICLAVIPAIYMPLFFFCAPESPTYLISKDYSKAREVIKKLRGESEVDRSMDEIQRQIENDTKMPIMEILSDRGLRKGFLTGFGLGTFTQLSGMGIIFSYAQTIFEEAGQDISATICPIILAVAQFVTGMITSSISEKFPRKSLLFFSYVGITISLIPLGAYFFLKTHNYNVSSFTYAPLVCLLAFIIVFNTGVGPVSMALLTELYPLKAKATILSVLVLYNWGSAFVITFLFNGLRDWGGMGVVFWFFAACCFCATIFIKVYLIETKGKTFEEIQEKLRE